MRAHKVTIEPSAPPVLLDDAKKHLRIDWTSDDRYIESLVDAARQKVEGFTRRALVNRTIEARFDGFGPSLWLPWPPLVSVSSVVYVAGDGTETTLATSVYDVDTFSNPARVRLAYGQSWPTPRAEPHAVRVTYVAGYGTAHDDVPADLRQAILLLVGHLYENREEVITGTIATQIPMAAESLMLPYVMPMDPGAI